MALHQINNGTKSWPDSKLNSAHFLPNSQSKCKFNLNFNTLTIKILNGLAIVGYMRRWSLCISHKLTLSILTKCQNVWLHTQPQTRPFCLSLQSQRQTRISIAPQVASWFAPLYALHVQRRRKEKFLSAKIADNPTASFNPKTDAECATCPWHTFIIQPQTHAGWILIWLFKFNNQILPSPLHFILYPYFYPTIHYLHYNFNFCVYFLLFFY